MCKIPTGEMENKNKKEVLLTPRWTHGPQEMPQASSLSPSRNRRLDRMIVTTKMQSLNYPSSSLAVPGAIDSDRE